MKISDDIFKAYDVRGAVGTELNESVVERIAESFANWLPDEGPIAIGRDMRPESKAFAAAACEGIIKAGRDVVDIGDVTTDMIYFATGSLNLAGGIMITASHNPGEYNGIKFCRKEARPVGIDTGLNEVKKVAQSNESYASEKSGKVTEKDVTKDWVKHVLEFVDVAKLKPYKVVMDAGNGMAGKIIPALQPHVPFRIVPMFFELDGSFPNHVANPADPKNIEDLVRKVQAEKADLGIAFDADGDRAVLVDETGTVVSGTEMTAILAAYLLDREKNATVLYNATCGWIVPETIKKHGGTGIRTKVGHSFIKADMRTHEALFAGETAGHFYFKDNFMADSGLIAAVIALAVLSESNQKLSELAQNYRAYHHIPETNYHVDNTNQAIESVSQAFPVGKKDKLDGMTIVLEDAWLNVRPSNTEPIIRFNAEARNKPALDSLVAKVTAAIQPHIR